MIYFKRKSGDDMEIDKKTIARIIQNARRAAKLTQAELAEKIGISEKHLSKIETGKNYPALDTFLKILNTLNLTLGDFGVQNNYDTYPNKLYLQKIIETLSKTQLDACADVISTLIKHI